VAIVGAGVVITGIGAVICITGAMIGFAIGGSTVWNVEPGITCGTTSTGVGATSTGVGATSTGVGATITGAAIISLTTGVLGVHKSASKSMPAAGVGATMTGAAITSLTTGVVSSITGALVSVVFVVFINSSIIF